MVRRQRSVNNYSSTLDGGIDNSTTTVEVASATGLPSEGDFYLDISGEIVLVTHVSGTTLTVIRGQEGTSAISHATGKAVTDVITAGEFTNRVNERMGVQALPYGRITSFIGGTLATLTASNFSTVGANTLVNDGNDGTIICQVRDMAGNDANGIVRTFDDSADWRITAHVGCPGFDYLTPDILHFGSRDGSTDVSSDYRGIEMTPKTDISATFRDSILSNPTKQVSHGVGGRNDFWARFEIRWNVSGSDDELRRYYSKDGVNWWLIHTATFETTTSQQVGMWMTFQTGASGDNVRSMLFSWHEEAIS